MEHWIVYTNSANNNHLNALFGKRDLGNILIWFVFQYTAFARTIIYAVSLGGDTDTIATMAGAIAGAYYGIDGVPPSWRGKCEGVADAEEQAAKLHKLALLHQNKTCSALWLNQYYQFNINSSALVLLAQNKTASTRSGATG